ncbi:FCD domain-containing protein [Microbacterium sp. CPCC 204701]|uniref:FCD domain-containing protein n=1 Tax=Microbacterium sp. CPCC 204701 TaxID=2493084 RepID=UPI000FD7DACD
MRDLHSEGLLKLSPRKGDTVRRIDPDEVREMAELCELLEPHCARLVAERITEDELVEARRLQSEMEAVDFETYFSLNRAFHSYLYECARSPRLANMLRSIHDSTPSYLPMAFARVRERHDEGLAEHREFLDACEARDGARDARIMTRHWRPVSRSSLARRRNSSKPAAASKVR